MENESKYVCGNCGQILGSGNSLMEEFKTKAASHQTGPPVESESNFKASHDFRCGAMWFEKEILEYLQANDWPAVSSVKMTDVMAELVDKIIK